MQTELIGKQADKQAQQNPRNGHTSQSEVSQLLNNSPRVQALAQLSATLNRRPVAAMPVAPPSPSPMPVAQAKKSEEEETRPPIQKQPNRTGLPDNLKFGVEHLSGISLDNVKVHYNSSKPAQLNALAYAQGTNIHLAPGHEKHLPHEAWHVVQQAQGRVKPTMQMKNGVPINDDKGLEHEADVMGTTAQDTGLSKHTLHNINNTHSIEVTAQRMFRSSKSPGKSNIRYNQTPENPYGESEDEINHRDNVRGAKIILGDTIKIKQDQHDKAAQIRDNTKVLASAPSKMDGLSGEVETSTFEGIHKDMREGVDEMHADLQSDKDKFSSLHKLDNKDLESLIYENNINENNHEDNTKCIIS